MIAEATATDMLTVSCIEDDDGLPALAEEWNALAGDVPFRRWDWLEASWRHFRNAQRSLFTLAVRNDDGKLVGLAPLYRQQTLCQGCVVRLLGSDEACSDYLGVLAAREHEDEVAKQVAYWLAGDGMGRWDLLELNGVDAADTLVRRLTACLEARGHTLHVRNGLNCWRLKLPDHWDDYLLPRCRETDDRNAVRYFARRSTTARPCCIARKTTTACKEGWRSWSIFTSGGGRVSAKAAVFRASRSATLLPRSPIASCNKRRCDCNGSKSTVCRLRPISACAVEIAPMATSAASIPISTDCVREH